MTSACCLCARVRARMCVFNCWTNWPIFTKFGMNVTRVLLESSPAPYFLISHVAEVALATLEYKAPKCCIVIDFLGRINRLLSGQSVGRIFAAGRRQHSQSLFRITWPCFCFFQYFYVFRNGASSSMRGGVWLLLVTPPLLGVTWGGTHSLTGPLPSPPHARTHAQREREREELGVPAEIRTRHFPNASRRRYCWAASSIST
jgi:hypothetical protein